MSAKKFLTILRLPVGIQVLQEGDIRLPDRILEEKENREINQLTDQFIKVKKELLKAKGEVKCPYCYQYNEPESIYCNRCGKKLEKKKLEEEDD